MAKHSFEDIINVIENDNGLSAINKARFHYFNPNGACAAKKAADERINEAVEAGLLKSGAIFAYGSMNDYHDKKISKMAMQKHPAKSDVEYAIKALYEDVAKIDAVIAEAK